MVNYGTGRLGDHTVSTNETEDRPVLEYQNLTVQSGNTLTLPSKCRLQVTGTLQVDGQIVVPPDIGGGGANDGAGSGGRSGGSLELLAKNITGSGTITVDGEDGADANLTNTSDGGSGSNGASYTIPALSINGSVASGGGGGPNFRREESWSGNLGKTGPNGMYEDSNVKEYFENYLITGSYITQGPFDALLPGSGGGGGSGSRSNVDGDNTSYDWTDGSGGGGGAGGSFFTAGGDSGDGHEYRFSDNNNTTHRAYIYYGDAGGGGGAGGFVLLCTESNSTSITITANGGNGGDGGVTQHEINENNNWETTVNGAGGGGGGGAGGLMVIFADAIPNVQVQGGAGGVNGGTRYNGTSRGQNGSPGKDGATFLFDVSEIA